MPLSLRIRAFARRSRRREDLVFTKTVDGWYIEGRHSHPTRPDGTKWGDGRVAGHRGLRFILVNENYKSDRKPLIGGTLEGIWNGDIRVEDAQEALQQHFFE